MASPYYGYQERNRTELAAKLEQFAHALKARSGGAIEVYEADGQRIFPVYSGSGGISARLLCYLAAKGQEEGADMGARGAGQLGRPWLRCAVELYVFRPPAENMEEVESMAEAFIYWVQHGAPWADVEDLKAWVEEHKKHAS